MAQLFEIELGLPSISEKVIGYTLNIQNKTIDLDIQLDEESLDSLIETLIERIIIVDLDVNRKAFLRTELEQITNPLGIKSGDYSGVNLSHGVLSFRFDTYKQSSI